MKALRVWWLSGLIFMMAGAIAFALPDGEKVENGDASFDRPNPTTLNVTASDAAVINFYSFNIAKDETVNFIQPSSAASVLSRVYGPDSSVIAGNLSANGTFILSNPNGISFTPSANVRVNNFIATTLEISTNNFINGNYVMERGLNSGFSQVLNDGTITADGSVALVGSSAQNKGVIVAKAGTVHLASGDKTTVSFDRKGLIQIEITEATSGKVIDANGITVKDAVANHGTIEGAQVMMSAQTASDIFEHAVNNTGLVKAAGVAMEGGAIYITSKRKTRLSGVLLAMGPAETAKVEVKCEESVHVSGDLQTRGRTSVLSDNNIAVDADITVSNGDCLLSADNNKDGVGAFKQASGTFITVPDGDLTIQSSGEGTLGNITTGGGLTLRQGGAPAVFAQAPASRITTGGSLTIGNGVTLRAADSYYKVSKDWSNYGQFIPEMSTVELVSDQVSEVIGPNTFNNFTVAVPDKLVKFDPDYTLTVYGTLTLQGSYGHLLRLGSINPPEQWKILPQGDTDIQYVRIGGCYNARGPPLKAIHSSSLGNLTNFDLDPYWTGEGATSNWSDKNNWDTGTVPTEFDTVTLDGITGLNPNKDSVIDADFHGSIENLYILDGYTGTLTIARDLTVKDFSCVNPGQVIVFNAGTLTTITGTLTMEGAADNYVVLKSSVEVKGSEFGIYINAVSDAQGNPYLEYVDVTYSHAYGPVTPVPAKHYYIPAELNINWDDTHTWTGGGAGNNASEGNNWGGTAPATDDEVIFNTGSKACTWDADAPAQLTSFSINSGYTGTITLGKNLTVTGAFTLADAATFTTSGSNYTLSAGSYTQSAGTFTGNASATITVTGNFTLSGGVFTSTSGTLSVGGNWSQTGGTFTHNNGTVDFTKAAGTQTFTYLFNAFYDIQHTGAGTLQLNGGGSKWYSADWAYRKAITFDDTMTSTADQSNFPVLVYLASDANLAAGAQTDGDDILFTDSSGNKLSHEIEKYASGTGQLITWVKLTTLSDTIDTTIYMYYGNPVAGSQQDKAGVWSNGCVGMWHLNDNAANTTVTDSLGTSNGTDGVNTSTHSTTGDLGESNGALSFNGTTTKITVTDTASIQNLFSAGGTVSAWIYPTSDGEGDNGRIVDKRDAVARPTKGYAVFVTGESEGYVKFAIAEAFSGGIGSWATTSAVVPTNAWTYVTVTYNDSSIANTPTMYISGQSVSVTRASTPSGERVTDAGQNMFIGNATNSSRTFAGTLDEIRMSNTIRDAGWIATEYNNQSGAVAGTYQTTGTQTTGYLTVSHNFTNSAGTLDLNGNDLSVSGAFSNTSATVKMTGDEVVSTPTLNAGSTAEYAATSGTRDIKDWTYTNTTLKINGSGGTFTLPGNLTAAALTVSAGTFNEEAHTVTISGNVTISGGTLTATSGTMSVGGNLSRTSGTFTHNSGTVVFNGTTNLTSGGQIFNNITIDSGKCLTLADYTLTTTDGLINGGNLVLNGNEVISGTVTHQAGSTVTYSGSGTYTALSGHGTSYANLVFNGGGLYKPDQNITVSGSLDVTSGTLNLNGKTMTVSGDFTVDGTFEAGGGVVKFDDASQVTHIRGITFGDLTVTTPGKTLIIDAGMIETITGAFTVTGTAASPITLQSSVTGQQWMIDPQGTRSVSYVQVRDSKNINVKAIDPIGFVDLGGNINWVTPPTPAGGKSSGTNTTPIEFAIFHQSAMPSPMGMFGASGLIMTPSGAVAVPVAATTAAAPAAGVPVGEHVLSQAMGPAASTAQAPVQPAGPSAVQVESARIAAIEQVFGAASMSEVMPQAIAPDAFDNVTVKADLPTRAFEVIEASSGAMMPQIASPELFGNVAMNAQMPMAAPVVGASGGAVMVGIASPETFTDLSVSGNMPQPANIKEIIGSVVIPAIVTPDNFTLTGAAIVMPQAADFTSSRMVSEIPSIIPPDRFDGAYSKFDTA